MKIQSIRKTNYKNNFNEDSIINNLKKNVYNIKEIIEISHISSMFGLTNVLQHIITNDLLNKEERTKVMQHIIHNSSSKILKIILEKELILEINNNKIIKNVIKNSTFEIYKIIKQKQNLSKSEKNELLNTACFYGKIKVIKDLIEDDEVDINNNNNKPLFNSIVRNKLMAINLLIKNNKLKISKENNKKLLFSLIDHSQEKVIKVIFNSNKFDITFNDNELLLYFLNNNRKTIYNNENTFEKNNFIIKLFIKNEHIKNSINHSLLKLIKESKIKEFLRIYIISKNIKNF